MMLYKNLGMKRNEGRSNDINFRVVFKNNVSEKKRKNNIKKNTFKKLLNKYFNKWNC